MPVPQWNINWKKANVPQSEECPIFLVPRDLFIQALNDLRIPGAERVSTISLHQFGGAEAVLIRDDLRVHACEFETGSAPIQNMNTLTVVAVRGSECHIEKCDRGPICVCDGPDDGVCHT